MKKLSLLLLFVPFTFTAFTQGNRPTSGCVTTMMIRHPENTIVCPGTDAVLISQVNYRPNGLATWQQSIDNGNTWQPVNSPHIRSGDDFTIDTLKLLAVTDSVNNRLYRAVYTQPCSSYIKIYSDPARINASVQALQLIQQPGSQNVCVGNDVAFMVTALGNSIAYQWQISNDAGNTFHDIPGEIQTTLTLNGITISESGLFYRCIISSTCAGTIISNAARLNVSSLEVSITDHPAHQTGCFGGAATLSIAADGPIQYQWQKTKDGSNYYNIENGDSAILEIPWISEGANVPNSYRCLILSQCKTLVSDIASVYYIPTPFVLPGRSVSRCAGDTIILAVLLAHESFNEQAYQYQWQVSTDNGATYENILNANRNYYLDTITSADENNNLYRCWLGNAFANCTDGYSNITTVYVNQPFLLTDEPKNQRICEGGTANFSIVASGSVSGYQWQESSDNGASFADVYNNYSAKTARLQLNRVTREQNNALYRCRVHSNCQNIIVFSDTVQLLVDTVPALISDTSVLVLCDTCKTDISNIFTVGNITSAIWSIPQPQHATQGVYYYTVSASNSCADRAAVFVNIKKTDTLKTCNRSTERINAGITGTHYQWQKKVGYYFVDIQDGYIENGVNSPTLLVYYPGYLPAEYRCVVDSNFYSSTIYILATNTWNGSVSSNWNDPENWNCGYVPSQYDEVIIPPNISRAPEIRKDATVAKLSVFNGTPITILQGIIFRILGYPPY